jgi:RNA polymerase sigma-70 factor (ECF subfamily)
VPDPEDTAEIVQEAFVRVWKARAGLRPDTASAYLYRTALNLAATKRRWRRVRTTLQHKLDTDDLEHAPEDLALARERAVAVRDAIAALPEDLRRVVELRDVTELSYGEIARILQIRAGTVGSRRHTALTRLRTALAVAFAAGVLASVLLRPDPPPQAVDDLLSNIDHPALVDWGREPAMAENLEPVATRRVKMYRVH